MHLHGRTSSIYSNSSRRMNVKIMKIADSMNYGIFPSSFYIIFLLPLYLVYFSDFVHFG